MSKNIRSKIYIYIYHKSQYKRKKMEKKWFGKKHHFIRFEI